MPEASQAEKNVFGADAQVHPVTGMIIETGIGAGPEEQQALLHCNTIEQTQGKPAADALREKVKAHHKADKDPVAKAEAAVKHARDHLESVKAEAAAKIKEAEDKVAAKKDAVETKKAEVAGKAAPVAPAPVEPAPAPVMPPVNPPVNPLLS